MTLVVAALGAGLVVLNLVLRLVALGVIPEGRKPSSSAAWLVMILALPVVGFLLFWLLGRTDVGRVRRERQAEALRRVRERVGELADADPGEAPAYLPSVLHLNRRLGAFPAVPAGPVVLHTDYDESIAAMAALVDRAEHRVHVESYITTWDETTEPLFDAMVAAAARGVTVRLLFDHLGCRKLPGREEMCRRLDDAGVAWRAMLPLGLRAGKLRRPDLRNHRKLLVVDGTWAVTGSQNLIEPSYHKPQHQRAGRRWVELTATVQGPLARLLDGVFVTDWYTETGELLGEAPTAGNTAPVDHSAASDPGVGQVVPSGPGVVAENNLRLFTALVYGATRRVSLTSPYFVPDESLLYAVTTAAHRGVEIELFVGEEGDQLMVHKAQCSYYRALLEAGVRIWLYEPPLVLHAKHLSIDDDVVVLGSSNMDLRSFALNYEVSTLLTGTDVVVAMRAVEDGYRARSRELLLEEWERRPRRTRFGENVFRLTSALQ
ncbi:PLDc N-terminal domain-containing protein [Nocardioides panacisoli]|uniref:phospholipase D-like domain-containing protein n=1 Tax=Nocardioides panacisoli TaxID=627624 RepID=UPI001C62ED26|nr:phospholipase D-like domain-containing protein [Nocardioides panacisoli]QYJ04833.1 PLDc N-terminal domain-containing protein [Nocardioides panacisoli]